ncbi:DNA-binding MarR family transcriptional regulator [Kribbella orskensis]|uniref:DNA-binding MarR family transcriptional regulator n=1 Tax=Kribbella orskensis TaxID=2512216 RepID=A0ABY2BHM2_9ACTN|nr:MULTISPECIES: MarR family winged helix-turn-helix transcriptional regulator [Kribbella]TCN36965.1 DNA-binding MarR family transcriptional regulator [Kribbella sp. VKM Ac-2500]TCO18390.1 DNA-binding MarR family transcriptional regulator [Kribbella orskensis]
MSSTDRPQAANTIAMLGQAYSLLGFKIVDGVVGAGYPQKPSHSAVFAQIKREGSRLTDLAKGANMTPQSMSELVAELVELGYVERKPDPTDGRAKLIVLTDRGNACIDAAQTTIQGLEDHLTAILGDRGHRQLRTLLTKLLAEG